MGSDGCERANVYIVWTNTESVDNIVGKELTAAPAPARLRR